MKEILWNRLRYSPTSDSSTDLFSSAEMKEKRERIAIAFAQGMLANPECIPKKVTSAAIFMAEEFILKSIGNTIRTDKGEG
jgi:hypothetical protein